MEAGDGSSRAKRPRPAAGGGGGDEDDDSGQPPVEKRPRFPKGKKVKRADEPAGSEGDGEGFGSWMDPQKAAKERAKRRNRIREEELFRDQTDLSAAEVNYEDHATFEDDGIQIEPFNLKQEREEGYFDAAGNFVEFAGGNEIKDAWLDSVEINTRFEGKIEEKIITDDDQELTPEDIGRIKRNIATLLQPGETIIQALKRFKGSSSDKRGKMSESTKRMFDQLTEDAVKLMENGEYNVYHDERETFEREAEGYERLTRARDGILGTNDNGSTIAGHDENVFSNEVGNGAGSVWDTAPSTSGAHISEFQAPSNDRGDDLDMFGDDDDGNNPANLQALESTAGAGNISGQALQSTSENLYPSQGLETEAGGALESDYVFDATSGYYYSSNLGYYYDATSGLYCCATTGTWYSFDEATGSYNAIPNVIAGENCAQG